MVNLRDIEDARKSISGLVKRTPLTRSDFLSWLCDGEVYLKLENQQITRSFKIRGALNNMLHLSIEQRERGVVTASAGNHAQAVAIGAEKLNILAKIFVPKSTPKIKVDKIRKYNVELLLYGNVYDEAEQKAMDFAEREGLTYISPYNDELVIAGQGTIGLDILEDLPKVNSIIVPVGGGGLISGIGVAVKSIKPDVKIIGVQSEVSPVMYESLRAGRIVDIDVGESVADGLHGGIEEESITFEIVQACVDDFLLVQEDTIRKAIALLWKKEGQVAEGAGAVATALMMENKGSFKGETVATVVSGGNIEEKQFRSILDSELIV